MILGANWIYTEPIHVHFQFFVFKRANGGLANDYPELRTYFETNHSEEIKNIIELIYREYPEAHILYKSYKGQFVILVGGKDLLDYDLFVALEIEKRISHLIQPSRVDNAVLFREMEWNRLGKTLTYDRFKGDEIRTVGGYFTTTKANSQQFYLAFRCELFCSREIFEADIRKILDEHDLDFGEYSELEGSVLIAIGNGRQGVNGKPIKHTDPQKLETDISNLVKEGKFRFGINPRFIHADEYTKLSHSPTRFIKMKTEDFDFIMSKNFQE